MEAHATPAPRREYRKPALVVYGRLEEITLTEFFVSPRNDKGSGDTKTA